VDGRNSGGERLLDPRKILRYLLLANNLPYQTDIVKKYFQGLFFRKTYRCTGGKNECGVALQFLYLCPLPPGKSDTSPRLGEKLGIQVVEPGRHIALADQKTNST